MKTNVIQSAHFLTENVDKQGFFKLGDVWKSKKRILWAFLFLGCVFQSEAQVSFLGEGTRWIFRETNSFDDYSGKDLIYEITGDTLINRLTWWKVNENAGTGFLIRENEDQEIWYADSQMKSQRLMYQFNKWKEGGSIFYDRGGYFGEDNSACERLSILISQVNTVKLLDGKTYQWTDGPGAPLIRGIGYTGGFFDLFGVVPTDGSCRELVRFYHNGDLIYDRDQNELLPPLTLKAVNHVEKKLQIRQQGEEILFVYEKENSFPMLLVLYDSAGRQIKKLFLKEEVTAMQKLPGGIYLYGLETEREKVESGRFTVNK